MRRHTIVIGAAFLGLCSSLALAATDVTGPPDPVAAVQAFDVAMPAIPASVTQSTPLNLDTKLPGTIRAASSGVGASQAGEASAAPTLRTVLTSYAVLFAAFAIYLASVAPRRPPRFEPS